MNYVNARLLAAPAPSVGVDGVIDHLQNRLTTLVPWLERVFGRAFDVLTSDGRTVPGIYAGGGEYFSALPNDNLSAAAFFVCTGPEEREGTRPDAQPRSQRATRRVTCCVWGDLARIAHAQKRDYPYAQVLIDDVVKVLTRAPDVVGIETVTDEPARAVFERYDLSRDERRYGLYPRFCFAVECTVFYRPAC